ncbi:hypothetical protein SANTM175S_03584 [Streptomyces antimycoticus]
MISAQAWKDARLIWDYHQMHRAPKPCSVAIGLGSHDLGVADTAVSLYERGMAPLLVFTGATSPTTRERMPRGEAVHYRERALELGVPSSAVLLEPYARNTGENIRFSKALLEEPRRRLSLPCSSDQQVTGCRGELCGLRWQNVDFDTNVITVRRATGKTDGS